MQQIAESDVSTSMAAEMNGSEAEFTIGFQNVFS